MKYRFVLQLDRFGDDDEDMFDGDEVMNDELVVVTTESHEGELKTLFDSLVAAAALGVESVERSTGTQLDRGSTPGT